MKIYMAVEGVHNTLWYSTSTVQYSTVQVSAVQYRDYKNDGQWTRQNEDINPESNRLGGKT